MENVTTVIKLENVKMYEDLSEVPLSTVVVEVENIFDEGVTTTTEVVEEEYVRRLYRAIAKDELAKRLVEFAWDMKDKTRNWVVVELNPQSLDIQICVTPFGYDYTYPLLHPSIFQLNLSEGTFDSYSTKEEAVANFEKIVTFNDEFEDDLYELYNVIIDTKFEDIYDEGYVRKYIRK